MGYMFTELVPPAILLDHPGVTREEYAQLLSQTHPSGREYSASDPWEVHSGMGLGDYSEGSQSVADALGLRYSQQFKDFQSATIDTQGLRLYPPSYYITTRNFRYHNGKRYHYVVTHERNRVSKQPVVVRGAFISEPGYREDIEHDEGEISAGIVTKVLRRRRVDNSAYVYHTDDEGRVVEREAINKDYFYTYTVELKPVTAVKRVHRYPTAEALYQSWPQFRPENKYDFTQTRGRFHVALSDDTFRWVQQDGRYYLDPATFDRIPASFRDRSQGYGFGYTDLILTAEAIKAGAWKLLSYRGLKHAEAFLADFPATRPRFEQAVWDSHTSLSAKRRNLTYTDLIKMRVNPSGSI